MKYENVSKRREGEKETRRGELEIELETWRMHFMTLLEGKDEDKLRKKEKIDKERGTENKENTEEDEQVTERRKLKKQ